MPGPYNFETQASWLRNLVLSLNRQAAWNAALADAALTRRPRFDSSAVMERTISRRSDQQYAGKGSSFASDGQITTYDTKFDGFKGELSASMAGWMLAFLMGTDAVTGAASPYTHSLTFDESTRTAIPTTIYCEDTEDLKYKCPDMCVDSVTLTISEIGAIEFELAMLGTGYQLAGAMQTVPAPDTNTYLLGSDAALTFGPTGGTSSFVGRHMKTVLKLENQLAVHKAPGGGLYGLFVRKGSPKFSIQTTIAAKDTDDVYGIFNNDTECAFTLNVNSGAAAQLNVSIPKTHLKTTKLGLDSDMIVWNLEADETTCYQAAGTPPITLQVINADAAYLTTPA